jgi:hypothetical protein
MPPIELKDQFSSLRNEIIESEKARIDLLKYKLVAIATLGAVGIGVGNYAKGQGFTYAICIIPFAAIYVDLLCFHNTLRIRAIARYLYNNGDPYEKFINTIRCRISFFELEDWALQWSSLALSAIIFIYGLLYPYFYSCPLDNFRSPIFIIVGILGISITLIMLAKYKKRVDLVSKCCESIQNEN